MSLVLIIITGLVPGTLAKLLTLDDERISFVVSGLLGISGALLAAWIFQISSIQYAGQNFVIVGSASGAMILLSAYRTLRRKL